MFSFILGPEMVGSSQKVAKFNLKMKRKRSTVSVALALTSTPIRTAKWRTNDFARSYSYATGNPKHFGFSGTLEFIG
jgi:hypothetical protein